MKQQFTSKDKEAEVSRIVNRITISIPHRRRRQSGGGGGGVE